MPYSGEAHSTHQMWTSVTSMGSCNKEYFRQWIFALGHYPAAALLA